MKQPKPTAVAPPAPRPLPAGWHWARLGEICELVSGSTPRSGVANYWDGKVPWITPTDLGRLKTIHILDSARKITKNGFESCGTEMVPKGSVVLSSRAPIGHLGVATIPLCTNQGCKSLVPGKELDSLFLYYALKRAVPELKILGSGATFAEVSKRQLQEFEIPLPPLAEQKRLAARLDRQMAAVAGARAAAESRLDAIRSLKNAFIATQLNEIRNCPVQKMLTICKEKGQYGLSVASTDDVSGVPILRMGNIIDGALDWSKLRYIGKSTPDPKDYYLADGDLLFNRTNSVELIGKSAVFTGHRKAVFASYLIRFRLRREVADPVFIALFINSPMGRQYIADNLTRAIGQANISASVMHEMPLPLPALAEQQRIAAAVREQGRFLERASTSASAECDTIDGLPSALLRRALGGEISPRNGP